MARIVLGRTTGERRSGRNSLEAIIGVFEPSFTSNLQPSSSLWVIVVVVDDSASTRLYLHIQMTSDLILSPLSFKAERGKKGGSIGRDMLSAL